MSDFKLSSKDFLKNALEPHKELALDLLKMVKSLDTNDPTHRFQIASIIIFFAGIDKTLSLAFELLYLVGIVDWNWIAPNSKYKPPAGFIECQRGLTSKIMKLKELGVDVTHLLELLYSRNEYIHSCSIYLGYAERFDEVEGNTRLNASGPVISFTLPSMTHFQPEVVDYYSQQLIDKISSYIDKTDWQTEWIKLAQKAVGLPQNPEPEYSQLLNEPCKVLEIIDALNVRYIGDGAKLLQD